jgi:hypothetical protein
LHSADFAFVTINVTDGPFRMSDQLARAHHSVPEAYLKGWSVEPGKVWTYRLLVPRESYPDWKLRHTAGLTRYGDLNTSSYSGSDSDWFERWLNEEVEDPAASVMAKVRADQPLKPEDWPKLAKYVASLDLRTPVSYLEQSERWAREVPATLQSTMANLERNLRRAIRSGELASAVAQEPESQRFPLRLTMGPSIDGKLQVRAEVVVGRQMWLWNQRRLLTSTANILATHHWTILAPHPGSLWFTSDHPVVRLNYYGEDRYDFGGGWGNRGTEILVPLSPRHLLYTKIGSKWEGETTASIDQTFILQRFVAERAHRWIFASDTPKRPVWFRPRKVDLREFRAEAEIWKQWHEHHRMAELGPAQELGHPEDLSA